MAILRITKNKLWWGFILSAVGLVYFPALTTFFSQDDFTHLAISQASSLTDIGKFFIPIKEGIFYRPLSVQIYTWFSNIIFGLHPMGWHFLALIFHFLNIFLVYKLLVYFLSSKRFALGGALIYGVHPVHFMSLFWVAEFSMVLGPFFAFLSIYDFVRGRYYRFWLWMLLGFLSSELVAAVPLFLIFFLLIRREIKKIKWLIMPCAGVVGLFLLRFVIKPTSLATEYVLSFNPLIWLVNLRWQAIRAFGLPEGFRAYWHFTSIKLTIFGLLLFWLIIIYLLFKNRRELFSVTKYYLAIIGFGWFILSLVPVLFLAHHQSPIYQIVGLPGFILAVLSLLPKSINKNLLLILAGLFIFSSFWSIRAMNEYHWITQRARIAKYHLEKLSRHQPKPGETVVFLNTLPNSSTEVYLALAGENAVKAFFGENLRVYFEDFSGVIYSASTSYIFSRIKI